jgi:hypothetical protein
MRQGDFGQEIDRSRITGHRKLAVDREIAIERVWLSPPALCRMTPNALR